MFEHGVVALTDGVCFTRFFYNLGQKDSFSELVSSLYVKCVLNGLVGLCIIEDSDVVAFPNVFLDTSADNMLWQCAMEEFSLSLYRQLSFLLGTHAEFSSDVKNVFLGYVEDFEKGFTLKPV